MRELHDWHERGDHGRHARDAHAPADGHAARAPEGPRHAAHNSPKLRMLLDPAARIAEQLRYGETVAGYSPKHAADQRKPADRDVDQGVRQAQGSDRPRTSVTENRTPPEGERRTPESSDKPATGIAKRRLEESAQVPDVAAREKPRLKDKAVVFWSAAGSWAVATAGDYLRFIPPHLAGEISGAIGVAALGILWRQSERTENRDGNRPKD